MSVTYKPDKRFHAAANLFPLMKDIDPRRWVDFCGSVARAGLLEPIVLLEDEILDGRNRYLACIETNTPPRFVQFTALGFGKAKPEAHEFAFLRNLERRDLTEDQRASICAAFMDYERAEAKQRMADGGKQGGRGKKKNPVPDPVQGFGDDASKPIETKTRDKLASKARISKHKAQQALNVQRDAPELLPNLQRGELTLVDASKQAVAKRDGSHMRSFADIKLKNEPVDPVARIMRQVHKLSRINFIALTSYIRDFAADVYPDMSCVMPAEPNKDVVAMAREAQPPQRQREPGDDDEVAA